MPNQHKNPGITWHPADPDLKDRIKAEASRQETTASRVLDEGMAEYLDRREVAGKQVTHRDGDPRNNDPSNLEIRESE